MIIIFYDEFNSAICTMSDDLLDLSLVLALQKIYGCLKIEVIEG